MKFILTVVVFTLFALAIGGGMLMMMHGKPWLFIVSLLVFVGLFAKEGCKSH